MVDAHAVGTRGTPFRLDIERGKIAEFARAIHADDPAFTDGEHPLSPPTFLTTAMFIEPVESGPWGAVRMDQQRGLHAEQEYVFVGPPPRAGTRLTGTSEITKVFTKQGRRGGELTFAVMETSYVDAAGHPVAKAIMTGVETGQIASDGAASTGAESAVAASMGATQAPGAASTGAAEGSGAPTPPNPSAPPGPSATPASTDSPAPADAAVIPLPPGVPPLPAPMRVGPVTRTDFVRYQGASGDFNPIHHDETFARAAGFASPFSVGMWQAGIVGGYATRWLGAANLRRYRIRFSEQVWPGDVLLISVISVAPAEGGMVTAEFACDRLGGGRAVSVHATFVVPDQGEADAEAGHDDVTQGAVPADQDTREA